MIKKSVAVAIGLAVTSLFGSALAENHKHQDDLSLCGHETEDSMEIRAQASLKSYWVDARAANPNSWARAKLLGFNDFHGALEQRSLFGRPVGGAAVLGAYLDAASQTADDGAIIIHAGDHVGAAPPISALLQDEPSIDFLNMLGNGQCNAGNKANPNCNLVGTLGNHEFDEGASEMLRLINGGNHQNGPFLDQQYSGTTFPYVNANAVYQENGKPLLPPYVIKRVKGMPVGIIGLVLKETPSVVTPTGVAGIEFLDEAETIKKYVKELNAKGVHAIVVTIHQGTSQRSYGGQTSDDPVDVGGSIGPIISKLDDDVDVVISGHWHSFTNALMPNENGKLILVTQAFSNGTAFTDIDIAIDPRSKDIVEKSAAVVTTWADEGPGLSPREDIAGMVATAADRVAPLIAEVIGQAADDITRTTTAAGESALGNLIADAQRSATGADIAFMNSGGIRADIEFGEVTWGDLFTVQPFGNDLVTMTLSGQQIVDFLNQQWRGQASARIVKPSGLTYTWDGKNTDDFSDDEVVLDSVMVNGVALDLTADYRVTANSFMAAGGDGYSTLALGTDRVIGQVDLDALIDYIKGLPSPFNYGIEGRIARIN